MSSRPVLVCRASKQGIVFIGENNNRPYPWSELMRELWEDLPRNDKMSEDEAFIDECMRSFCISDPRFLNSLPPREAKRMKWLRVMTKNVMVDLKVQAAHNWSKRVLNPWLNRHIPISKTERVSDLLIKDADDGYLDINIPRPVLIDALLRMKARTKA